MVALATDMQEKLPMQHWAWGLLAVILVFGAIGIFMLAGVGLYLTTMGRPCG